MKCLLLWLLIALTPSLPTAQPIACNLAALNHAERDRLTALLDKLTTGAMHRQELPDGYAYEIRPEKLSFREVAEWVSLESRCCPFLNFRIDLAGGAVRLQLTGGSGVKQFIQSEMHRLPK